MSFEDLFLAGLALGLGFFFAKFAVHIFSELTDSFWEDWKKPWYIISALVLLAFFLYCSFLFSPVHP